MAALSVPAAVVPPNSTSVAFYAHKGGVGKSTLIFDAAYWTVKNTDKNVVIIDADSQLNTTFKLLGRSSCPVNEQLIDALLNQDFNVTMLPITQGDGVVIQKTTLYTHISGAHHNFNFDNDFIKVANMNDRCHFLVGTPILHKLEMQLVNAIQIPANSPATADVPLLFYRLLTNIKHYFQQRNPPESVLILVDMSPNSNYMNQNMLLSCDYFVMPCNADDNSMVSVRLLFSYLHRWVIDHGSYLPRLLLDGGRQKPSVKFLFVVLNRYKIGALQDTTPTMINKKYATKIRNMIIDFENQRINRTLINYQFLIRNNTNTLLTVQNGMRFTEMCSEDNMSIFEITQLFCSRKGVRIDQQKVDSMQGEGQAMIQAVLEGIARP